MAKCARSHCWHLGQCRRNSLEAWAPQAPGFSTWGTSGWARLWLGSQHVSYTTRWLLFTFLLFRPKGTAFLPGLGSKVWTVGFTPSSPFPCLWPGWAKRVQKSQREAGSRFRQHARNLGCAPILVVSSVPIAGSFPAVLQRVGGCNSVQRTPAKVCRGAWLADLKCTVFAFFPSWLCNITS